MKSNYYIVRRQGQYHYFPVKVKADTKNLPVMRFEKGPPLLLDGYVIIDRVLYRMPVRDIQRNQINTLRKIEQPKREKKSNGRAATNLIIPSDPGTSASASGIPVATADTSPGPEQQPELSDSPLMAVDPAADAAWKEQVESLLDTLHQEEGGEWEVADSLQP
jgi:hypothetical protein